MAEPQKNISLTEMKAKESSLSSTFVHSKGLRIRQLMAEEFLKFKISFKTAIQNQFKREKPLTARPPVEEWVRKEIMPDDRGTFRLVGQSFHFQILCKLFNAF